MAVTPVTMQGTIKAEVGIKISEQHTNWRVLGEVEIPYTVTFNLESPEAVVRDA